MGLCEGFEGFARGPEPSLAIERGLGATSTLLQRCADSARVAAATVAAVRSWWRLVALEVDCCCVWCLMLHLNCSMSLSHGKVGGDKPYGEGIGGAIPYWERVGGIKP
jgi:hypothetical protein